MLDRGGWVAADGCVCKDVEGRPADCERATASCLGLCVVDPPGGLVVGGRVVPPHAAPHCAPTRVHWPKRGATGDVLWVCGALGSIESAAGVAGGASERLPAPKATSDDAAGQLRDQSIQDETCVHSAAQPTRRPAAASIDRSIDRAPQAWIGAGPAAVGGWWLDAEQRTTQHHMSDPVRLHTTHNTCTGERGALEAAAAAAALFQWTSWYVRRSNVKGWAWVWVSWGGGALVCWLCVCERWKG